MGTTAYTCVEETCVYPMRLRRSANQPYVYGVYLGKESVYCMYLDAWGNTVCRIWQRAKVFC